MSDPTTDRTATELPDISTLSYERARDELVAIVARLESGQLGLDDSMALWERGEALAEHCTRWLEGAQARLQGAEATGADTPADTPAEDDSDDDPADD